MKIATVTAPEAAKMGVDPIATKMMKNRQMSKAAMAGHSDHFGGPAIYSEV